MKNEFFIQMLEKAKENVGSIKAKDMILLINECQKRLAKAV